MLFSACALSSQAGAIEPIYGTSSSAPAEPDYIGKGPFFWIEPSWGPGNLGVSESFKLKFGSGQYLYGLEFASTKDGCEALVNCPMTRDTFESFAEEFDEINLLIGYRTHGRFYHFSGDIGLGYISGQIGTECKSSSFRSIQLCERTELDGISVPINFTLLFGKFIGTGLNFHATFSQEAQFYSISLLLALGHFN